MLDAAATDALVMLLPQDNMPVRRRRATKLDCLLVASGMMHLYSLPQCHVLQARAHRFALLNTERGVVDALGDRPVVALLKVDPGGRRV
jgi:hypothetical protein